MTKLVLRDYQEEAVHAVVDGLDWGYNSLLVTAATGTGKTVCFSQLVRRFVDEGKKVLILAPRRELIDQAYIKIRDMCDLKEEYNEIDKEMGSARFDRSARVVVGCVNTCYKETRLQEWVPDIIICDEGHFVRVDEGMWKQLFDRFPEAIRIGFTATAMRGDKAPVYHEGITGTLSRVEERGSRGGRETLPEECSFFRHVYDYPLEQAVNDGWLVEPRGYTVESGVDISVVKSSPGTGASDGDFNQKELNAALSKDQRIVVDRINRTIGRWEEVACDRPTVAFCPSVEYSEWAADLWRQAGYKAVSVNCETDSSIRDVHHHEIKKGNIQITCNYGIYTHGTDIPEWSCVVILRPTESTGLLSQMIGRGTRPDSRIAHVLGTLSTSEERLQLIADSCKPDCIVIDVHDICGKHKLATLPTVLGLSPKLDLQGRKLTDAAKLIREFECAKSQVLHECPATYEELEASLRRISILNTSGSKTRGSWMVSEDGSYTHGHTPIGYTGKLFHEYEEWRLMVIHTVTGEAVFDKQASVRPRDTDKYFDSADAAVRRHVEAHKKANPEHGRPKGTISWIRGWKFGGEGPIRDMKRNGFTEAQIDCLTKKQFWAIWGPIRDARREARSA